jgi:hypothetical protein
VRVARFLPAAFPLKGTSVSAALAQLGSRWPLLVLEEAQNVSASALWKIPTGIEGKTRALNVKLPGERRDEVFWFSEYTE